VARADGVPSAGERVRLLGVDSRADWTDAMQGWAAPRLAALQSMQLSGYIFKASSPSCGIHSVRVLRGDAELRTGRGLFAEALVTAMPELPVADEEQLAERSAAEAFLARARRYHDARG
jgi:uncharacterized protein YbbK (DUF523 family)